MKTELTPLTPEQAALVGQHRGCVHEIVSRHGDVNPGVERLGKEADLTGVGL